MAWTNSLHDMICDQTSCVTRDEEALDVLQARVLEGRHTKQETEAPLPEAYKVMSRVCYFCMYGFSFLDFFLYC